VQAIRPGFPESPKALWFLEEDVERYHAVLCQRAEGLRLVNGERCLILAAAAEYLGVAASQVLRWEKFCAAHPELRLRPILLRGKRLKLVQGKAHPGKGKNGRPSAKGLERVYRIADLDQIKAGLERPPSFTGEYPTGPDGRRFNLPRAEIETGLSYGTLLRYSEQTDFHPAGHLPTEERRRPEPPWKVEKTVLERDLILLRDNIAKAVRQATPAGAWATAREIGDRLGLDRGERIKLQVLLQILRDGGLLCYVPIVRKVKGRAKQRKVWHYDFAQLQDWLDGRSLAEALKVVTAETLKDGAGAEPQDSQDCDETLSVPELESREEEGTAAVEGWSEAKSPTEWAKVFEVHYNTMIDWLKKQRIKNRRVSPRRYRVATFELPLEPEA
jgi:hypothetical protein